MEASSRIFCCIVLFTTLDLGQRAESEAKGASPAKDGFTTTWKLASNYLVNPFDRPRIPRQLPRKLDEIPLFDRPEDQWHCKDGVEFCVYISSRPKNWLDASESCVALGGKLPCWEGFHDKSLVVEKPDVTMWSSWYWEAGRGHFFWVESYSPAATRFAPDFRHIAKGEHCFATGFRTWLSQYRVDIEQTQGYECKIALPFMCITAQPKFNETQRKLRLPLKQVIDIEIQKIAGPDPGTQVLRCVPKFKDKYVNQKDRPFNTVWIIDGAYYPYKGIPRDDHSTTINVPYKHCTKYACEVRYLGSFYGNRSPEIEVATPSWGKLGVLIRVRNATFSISSLDYSEPIKKLVEAIDSDHGTFKLSLVWASIWDLDESIMDILYKQNGSELVITAYLLSETFQGRGLKDMINFEKQIESLNALLNGSSIHQNLTLLEGTLEAIEYFESRIRDGTLGGVQFFAADRCPLERSASYFWAGGVGQRVQPSWMGDKPAEICLDEYDYPVTRTCTGSLFSGAQWVEPFSEEQNCSRASNKSAGTFCHAGYSLVTLAEKKGVYCVKQIPPLSWNNAMESCFGADILTLSELSVLHQYDPTAWIHSTIDHLNRGNASGALTGNLLWLPSRRRVPSGPLYPYMMPSGLTKQTNYSDWEVLLPGSSGFNKRLSYGDLDPSKLCLAWSVKAQTLTTRSCSERHPTVCIGRGHPVGAKEAGNIPELMSFYIPDCRGFDYIVVDPFGPSSCQKLIRARTSNGSLPANFTWEEAQTECERLDKKATLAIPTRYTLPANNTNTRMRLNDDANASITQATWFGVRQSGARSNNSCRLVTSTNQCAGPVHGFSSDTDFLHGVYVSSSEDGQDSLTLRLPETRLSQAMCQLNFQLAPPAETPGTYNLKLVWKDSTGNTLKLYLTREGSLLPGYDWEKILKHERQFIRKGLVCFGDGLLLDMSEVGHNEDMEIYFEFPSHVVSLYCESRTSTAIFLSSNTVLWRQAKLTFVVTVRDRQFHILPGTELFKKEDLQGNEALVPSKLAREHLKKSQFAERFEPSKISNGHLRQSGSVDIQLGHDTSEMRKYTVLDTKYDRVIADSKHYEELLVRYHVVFNSNAENLNSALTQLRGDMGYLMERMKRPSYNLEALRSMVTCPEEVEERPLGNLTWIETQLDRTIFSREGCEFEYGALLQRTCISDIYHGAYWGPTQAWNAEGPLVNLSSKFICASPSETTSRLLNITETRQNATSTLAQLQQVTSQWDPIIGDVQLTAFIISKASREETKFSQTTVEQTASIIQQVLNVDTNTLANTQKLANVSTNLLMGIEEILTNTNASNSTLIASALRGSTATLTGSSPFLFAANSSNLGELNDTVENTEIIRSASPSLTVNHQHDVLVVLNVSSLIVNRINASQIAFVYHSNIRLADAAVAAGETYAKVYSPNPSDGDHDLLRTAKHTANSAMVQVAVNGGPVYNLSEPVQIYFRPFRVFNTTNSSHSAVCAFWHSKVNNGHGGWSTQGCSYQGSMSGLDYCQCNHLSTFTTFFAYEDYEPTSHDSTLDSLTKIGCGLSLLGCIGVIATYTFLPKWRQPKPGYYGHHVIFHLSLALAMLLSTFLGAFDQTSDAHVCLFIAALLHYLMLVVFFWMLVEAYCHYSLFLRVLGSTTSKFMLKAALFAWVLPLVPVIALVVLNRELYYYKGEKKYCWLKPQGFHYALLPLAALIGFINLALYILIIVKMRCAKSSIRSTQSKSSFTPYTAVVIFFIMGLSWVFGLLAIGRARTFFSYLFCFFNSLQGFAIFLHFIFRGARAKEEWQNFIEGKSDREKARDKILDQAKLSNPSTTLTSCATSETSTSTVPPDREKSHGKILDQAKPSKPWATHTCCATSETSTCAVHSRIIGELKNRQRQQSDSQYEMSNL